MSKFKSEQLAALPALPPADEDGQVFAEPWQAQAFAMTLELHAQGRFSWPEWVAVFACEIAAAAGDSDVGDRYYEHWLAALEKIVAEKHLISDAERLQRKDAWAKAAAETLHGEPILLPGNTSKSH